MNDVLKKALLARIKVWQMTIEQVPVPLQEQIKESI